MQINWGWITKLFQRKTINLFAFDNKLAVFNTKWIKVLPVTKTEKSTKFPNSAFTSTIVMAKIMDIKYELSFVI